MEEKQEDTKSAAPGIVGEDYINEGGILICGKCGTPKQMLLPPILGETAKMVPIPCECEKRANEEREEHERQAELKRKADARRKECFATSGFYRSCTFETDDGRSPDTSSVCERYASTFDGHDPYGLLLWGGVGTGKSFMASAIANRVIDMGFTALHTDMRHIVNLMESSFENRQRNLDRILSYDLLVIEDLGAQRDTSYIMEHVYTIIDGRYNTGKPMVITTNFNAEKIASTANDESWSRIFDRILERCYPVKFGGENRRKLKKMEMRAAMEKRLGL